MKPNSAFWGTSAHSLSMTRLTGILFFLLFTLVAHAQSGDTQLRAKADALFEQKDYLEALPLYSQLVSLSPGDRNLNYRFGTCLLFGGNDKDKAIGHLKFAVQDPAIPSEAWYWLGRAYHLSYLFKDAQAAYQRYQGTGSKKELEGFSVAALDKQCRNGQNLLSNLKEITVRNKVEVEDTEFFRFYELSDIGGKIVVLPEELKTPLDKKSKLRTLVYLPEKGGPIYFGSYGKDGKTGRDIYRTELMPEGTFATPVKLAGYVNTDQDEDFAFLHPDGKSFYFSSKGHNSMGGYDVFRSAYDKGMDTFGPPENLDFAVNTPDDDLFYMVDAENKEACFASGRDSKQGMLHVYRVGTAQVPVVITILKGTYASAFNADDRKARIIVEDAVTRERVADVRTDMNGSYVLSLPRSGQFRYSVECGPSGKTHQGTVDVPRATSPRAYRQELELTKQGDLEKLVIRNYFDTPLEEDMIALMMEEIKRRARLDVTSTEEAIAAMPVEDAPTGDVLTRAGFAGDVTEAQAVQLAKADVAEQEQAAEDLAVQSQQAFGLAVEAVAEAERTAREAEAIATTAATEATEEARNARMLEAARLRQSSKQANQRARAAYRTAQTLEAAELTTRQRAAQAAKLAMDLEQTMAAKKEAETVAHLRLLKERLDTKSGPQGEVDFAEQARRALADQEREAARSLNVATSKRSEENELADRIARSKRERDETRNKTRKDELTREITQSEQQLAYLREEVAGAFTKAREQERETALMRGQTALTRHLTTAKSANAGTELTADQVTGLGQRIASTDTRISQLPIDERFDALVAAPAAELEARTFNWDLAAGTALASTSSVATQSAQRDRSNDAQLADGRTITTVAGEPDQGELRTANVGTVPMTRGEEDLANAGSAVGGGQQPATADAGTDDTRQVPAGTTASDLGTDDVTARSTGTEADANGTRDPANDGPSGGSVNDGRTQEQDPLADVQKRPAGREEGGGNEGSSSATNTVAGTSAANVDRIDSGVDEAMGTTAGGEQENIDNRADASGSGSPAASASLAEADPSMSATPNAGPEMDAFLLENQQAELKQALAAEKNPAKQMLLKEQLRIVDQRMAESAALANEAREAEETAASETSTDGVDMERSPAIFHPGMNEEDIITLVYPGYSTDKLRLQSLDDATARAEGLSGLELMLADSLRGELVRQAAILELDPQQGERVLPKMERLRMIRQAHMQEADRILADHEAATADPTMVSSMSGTPAGARTQVRYPAGKDPVADRFVALQPDPQEVFASKLEHRSKEVAEAVALKDADLSRMDLLDIEVDSLEAAMNGLPRKEYDKLRRAADRLIDERMIIRTELGQRSSFIAKEEWRTATDSLKGVDKQVGALGLPPDENLLLMAQGMQTDAKAAFGRAETLRKQADRSEDILLRDSLFRTAYGLELQALQSMDRAITVKNYLLGGRFQRGETLAYNVIAERVLGLEEVLVAENPSPSGTTAPRTGNVNATVDRTAAQDARTIAVGTAPSAAGVRDAASSADAAEVARTETAAEGRTDAAAASTPNVNDTEVTGTPTNTTSTGEELATPAVDTERARALARELADRTEATMPAEARAPAKRYEDYLQSEPVELTSDALTPEFDPQLLTIKVESAARTSAELEQRSLELADRATALEDSLVTARKRDKAELERLAVRTRLESDSLHMASLAMAEEMRGLEMQKRDAEQANVLRERLVKYYYLTAEEQGMVVEDNDQSRYFQARARALEQYDAATEAESAARINRELGEVLQKEVTTIGAERAAGRITPAEAEARQEVLSARADLLFGRADSLQNIAARLKGAAGINESQAAVMLQAMPAHRSTELMALEMRTRRTESLLAEARGQAGAANGATLSGGSTVDAQRSEGTANGNDSANERVDATSSTDERTASRNEPPARESANVPATTTTAVEATAAPTTRNAGNATFSTALPFAIPEELVTDMFELRPPESRTAATIPMDARMPQGIVFKVQIGAFRNAIREEAFSDMTPVMGENTESGLVRYTAGLFTGFQQAAVAKEKVRDRGYRDAFVVAYRDGVRIPLGVAMREVREAQPLAANSAPAGTQGRQSATGTVTTTPATTTQNPATVQPTPADRTAENAPQGTATTTRSTQGTSTPPPTTGNTVLEPAVRATTGTVPPGIISVPVATPAAVTPPTAEELLAKYPTTAEAIVSAFVPQPDASAYYNVPGAAPANQVETIRGLFYTVQVGVYSKPVALDKLFNITPLNSERTETAKVRYTTGIYTDTEQARIRKDQAVGLGVKDAFITAYLNGKRIPMQEAAALLQQFGPAILAQP